MSSPATALVCSLFTGNDGRRLKVWVDPRLDHQAELISSLKERGAETCSEHSEPGVRILVLHDSSTDVFDEYCHPKWLTLSRRLRYQRLVRGGAVEEWKRKTMVSDGWVVKCLAARRVLGEEDGWGGCRKGG